MIHEYAVEPNLLNNWDDFRYFSEQFGVSRGRLISRYPKKWEKMVYQSLSSCPPVEKKKIEEGLFRLKDRMWNRQSTWDPHREWLPNSEEEHGRKPFHAILARDNPRSQPFVLEAHAVDESHPLWKVEVSQTVVRTPQEVGAHVGPLLSISDRILFVDPYFRPSHYEYRMLFAILVELAVRERTSTPPSLEIFASTKMDPSEQCFFGECSRYLPNLIPAGIQVRIGFWSQRAGGEEIHNRYILTDRGGVKFGNSLREGDSGTTDDINLLSGEQHKLRFEQYAGSTPTFDQMNSITVVGTRLLPT